MCSELPKLVQSNESGFGSIREFNFSGTTKNSLVIKTCRVGLGLFAKFFGWATAHKVMLDNKETTIYIQKNQFNKIQTSTLKQRETFIHNVLLLFSKRSVQSTQTQSGAVISGELTASPQKVYSQLMACFQDDKAPLLPEFNLVFIQKKLKERFGLEFEAPLSFDNQVYRNKYDEIIGGGGRRDEISPKHVLHDPFICKEKTSCTNVSTDTFIDLVYLFNQASIASNLKIPCDLQSGEAEFIQKLLQKCQT